MITITCPECAETYRVSPAAAEMNPACPNCGGSLTATDPTPDGSVAIDPASLTEIRRTVEQQQDRIRELAEENLELREKLRSTAEERQSRQKEYELVAADPTAEGDMADYSRNMEKIQSFEARIAEAAEERSRITKETHERFNEIKKGAARSLRSALGQASGQFKVRTEESAKAIQLQAQKKEAEVNALQAQRDELVEGIARREAVVETLRDECSGLEQRLDGANDSDALKALRQEVDALRDQAAELRDQTIAQSGDQTIPPVPDGKAPDLEPQGIDLDLDLNFDLDLDEGGEL